MHAVTPRARARARRTQHGHARGLAPFQLPDPLQPARSLTDLLTAVAALLARRPPHRAPLLLSAWTVHQVITEECRILESVHCELGTPTPAAWIQVVKKRVSLCATSASSVFRSLRARSSRAFPLVHWQVALRALPTSTSKISHSLESRPSCVGSSAWFLSCAFWICLQIASTPGVMLRWLGLVFLARASSHFPRFCVCSALLRQRRGWFSLLLTFG